MFILTACHDFGDKGLYPVTYCADGQFHGNHAVGPMGFRPRTWKTEAGAARWAQRLANGGNHAVRVEVAA